jgi:hypothetical protein
MEHYLLVDATGQLGSVCLHFVGKVKRVSMISTSADQLDELEAKTSEQKLVFSGQHVNIADGHQLRHALESLIADNGPADVTIAALGSAPLDTAALIAQTFRDLAVFTEYFDVVDSKDEASLALQREGRLRSFENLWYRKIEVGRIVDSDARKLNNDELTSSVIRAVEERKDESSIGQS